jgi:hypothetical protein
MVVSIADVTAANLEYASAIGARARVGTSDTIVIGKTAGNYDGVARPADTVQIPGNLDLLGTLNANGSGLADLNASNITTGTLPIERGGTGSTTQNFVDLSTNQTIFGNKNFSQTITAANATVSNLLTAAGANLNGLAINNPDPVVINGDLNVGNRIFADQFIGSGESLTNIVSLSGDQTIAGIKTFTNGISANTAGFGTMTASGNISIGGFITLNLAPANLPQVPVCWTAFRLAGCSSSRRYKRDIRPLASGLDLIKNLRPVTYRWMGDGTPDLGLIAEEVAEVEPLLTTHNEKGRIEGVKYDRIGVIAVNAIKEQQAQIEAQLKLIEQQQKQIDALRKVVCAQNATAEICTAEEAKR